MSDWDMNDPLQAYLAGKEAGKEEIAATDTRKPSEDACGSSTPPRERRRHTPLWTIAGVLVACAGLALWGGGAILHAKASPEAQQTSMDPIIITPGTTSQPSSTSSSSSTGSQSSSNTSSTVQQSTDWSTIAAAAAPWVYRVKSYNCLPGTSSLCSQEWAGTGYVLQQPKGDGYPIANGKGPVWRWPALAISANHMACDPNLGQQINTMDFFNPQNKIVFRRHDGGIHGLCEASDSVGGYNLGDPMQDIGAWVDTGAHGGLVPSTHAAAPGEQVIVMGNPNNLSTGDPIVAQGKVIATNVTFDETGDVNKTIKGAIELQVNAFPGNSGSPVLNSRGHVVGTLIAGGPQDKSNGTAVMTAYVIPITQVVDPFMGKLIEPVVGQ